MLKVLIQGEAGSFHHQAAEQLFGDDIEIVPCATFSELFSRLDQDDQTVGLSAIENSLYGSINEVHDLLEKSGAQIFAETELVIHQNLIGLPGADVKKIKEVYSHPVALAQCENYLNKYLPSAEKIEFEDTAAAVRHVAELKDPTKAAIAGIQTLKLFDVKMLADSIEDSSVNYTRFVALTKSKPPRQNISQVGKSSLILITGHHAGALYEALGVFVAHQLNMTKLQSRPIIGEKWRYKFYIDFLGDAKAAKDVVDELRATGNEVWLLGSY